MVSTFEKFGFPGITVDAFLTPGAIVRAGYEPFRIEVLNEIAGVAFGPFFKRRERFDVDGLQLSVIGLRDLLQNKRAADRHKDLADVEVLSPRPRAKSKEQSQGRQAAKEMTFPPSMRARCHTLIITPITLHNFAATPRPGR